MKLRRMTLPTLLSTLAVVCTAFPHAAAAEDAPRRYTVESGIITYRLSGFQTGAETIYFDRWGMREAKYTVADIDGVQKAVLKLTDGEWTYQINLDTKTGVKSVTPYFEKVARKSGATSWAEMSRQMMDAFGGEVTGKEEVAGKLCDVWNLPRMNTRIWMWNWITLKTHAMVRGKVVDVVATDVKIGVTIPAQKLMIPDGVIIGESPAIEEMKKLRDEGR